MPDGSGVDVAVLGLQVDARQFVQAGDAVDRFVAKGEQAEATAKRMTSAVDRAGAAAQRNARAQARSAAEAQRMQESADAAHRSFLANKAARERAEARDAAARAALAGREQALSQTKAAERVYREEVARIKQAQALGLLTSAEAAQAGRESAQAYNTAVLRVLERGQRSRALVGADGSAAFTQIAGSLKNVDQAGRRANLGLGRLNDAFVTVARQATGTSPVVGKLADTIGTFAIGTGFMVPVLAGIAALGLAWQEFTRDSRRAREEAKRAADSLRALAESANLDLRGRLGKEVDDAIHELDRLDAKASRLGSLATAAGNTPLGGAFGPLLRQMIANTRSDYVELAEARAEGERQAAEAVREEAKKYVRMLQEQRDRERRIHEERARAFSESLEAEGGRAGLFGTAVDVGVLDTVAALERAMVQLREASARLLRVEQDKTRSLEDQVRAAKARLEVEQTLERLQKRTAIQRQFERGTPFDGPTLPRNFNRSTHQYLDLTADPLSGFLTSSNLTVEWQAAQDQLEAVREAEEKLRMERERQTEAAARVVLGLVAVADGFGLIEGRARGAVRGVSDMLAGLQALQAADGLQGSARTAALAGGVAGIVGGLAGALSSVLGDNGQRERLEAERTAALERNNARLRDLAEALRERGRTAAEFRQGGALSLDTLDVIANDLGARLANLLQGTFGTETLDDALAGLGISLSDLERLAQTAGITIRDSLGRLLPEALRNLAEAAELLAQAVEKAEAAAREDLRVRELAALGLDKYAEAEARRLEQAREIQAARDQGFSDEYIAYLRSIQALEDAALAREREARAAEEAAEAARKLVEQLREQAQFAADVTARGLALEGRDREALAVRFQAQAAAELAAAQDLLAAGTITQELFDQLAAVLAGEFNRALDEFDRQLQETARAAEEAARAEAFRQQMDLDSLRVRLLLAQGLAEEAQALRDNMELMQAVQDGRNAEYLALLQMVLAEEARKRALDESQRATEAFTRQLDGMTRVLNGPAGLPLNQIRAGLLGVGAPGPTPFSPPPIRGPAPVNITINQQPGQDAQALARMVVTELNRAGRAGDGFVLPEA